MPEGEQMLTCPYNVAHVIIKNRMPLHLTKCRKQYPTSNYKQCPYTASHDVAEPEFEYHLQHCEHRAKVDKFKYMIGEDAVPEEEPVKQIELPSPGEDWEGEATGTSYLDIKEEVLERAPVLRLPVGETKTKRRDFFNHEIRRVQTLIQGEEPDESPRPSSYPTPMPPPDMYQRVPSSRIGMGRGTPLEPKSKLSQNTPIPGRNSVATISSSKMQTKLSDEARALSPDFENRKPNVKTTSLKTSEKETKKATTVMRDDDDDDEGEFQIVVRHRGRGRGSGRR